MTIISGPHSLPAIASLLAFFAWGIAGPALGAAQRTFVASYGLTANTAFNCSLAKPCRAFNEAISVTNLGGEVVILDTAGYGPMTITQSIKIIGPSGVYGGISVQGGASPTIGIVINAGNNDEITLRGLDISGVPGSPPTPLIGIDVVNAGAVHIEKSSIGNFTDDLGACIRLDTGGTVRLYVVDSMLRECRTGVRASGNTVIGNSSSVIVDNTRIERGRNTTSTDSYGISISNHLSLTLRNSVISRQTTGLRIDSALSGAATQVAVVNSEITRVDHGLVLAKTAPNAPTNMHFSQSQITNTIDGVSLSNSGASSPTYLSLIESAVTNATNLIAAANSGVGANTHVKIEGGEVAWSTNGIVMSHTAADPNTRMYLDLARVLVSNITNRQIDASANNGSKTYVNVDSVMFGNTNTVLRTSGDSQVTASLVRSQVHNCTTVVDHGSASGAVRLDGNHFVACTNDFVNSGSSNMVTFKNNFIHNIDNTGGLTYITPSDVLPR